MARASALIATLLPDPGNVEDRARLLERIGGRILRRGTKDHGAEKSEKAETVGVVLK